ncbi:MAG TPA: alpha/beta hydrolase [Gemmatimonadaceae bacterium]|nr:alpha/beta hydrolase [Gemmatimonadaceae bacterium]
MSDTPRTSAASLAEFRRSRGRTPPLETRSVEARGLRFHVRLSPPVAGAVPLLCVNGGLIFDHASLWPTMAPLAERRQVVLYDQRGRGKSQAPPGARAARIEHDAGDIPALRAALGIARWDILGHSWGGGISMLAAAQDQAAVRRLVLVDAVGPSGWWLPTLHAAALRRLAGRPEHATLAALDPTTLHEPDPRAHAAYARAFSPAWFANPELAAPFTPPLAESPTGAAAATRLRRGGYDWRATLRALDVPTLVLFGEEDLLPLAVAEELVATLPRARLATVPDAGHMPFWENPAHFFRVVEQWLDDTV